MDHVVRYRSADGADRWEEVDGLEAAVGRVESLHNDAGVSDVRIYRQIALKVETYVKVAVVDPTLPAPVPTGSAPVEPPAGAMPLAPPIPVQAPATAAEVDAPEASADNPAENRKISLFNRS